MDSRYIIGDNDSESDLSTETEYSSDEEEKKEEEKDVFDMNTNDIKLANGAQLQYLMRKSTNSFSRPILSRKEFVKILGSRESQLANNMPPTVPITEGMTFKQIAIKELMEKQCPYLLKRLIPYNNEYEVVDVNQLIIPEHLVRMIKATS